MNSYEVHKLELDVILFFDKNTETILTKGIIKEAWKIRNEYVRQNC